MNMRQKKVQERRTKKQRKSKFCFALDNFLCYLSIVFIFWCNTSMRSKRLYVKTLWLGGPRWIMTQMRNSYFLQKTL